MSGVNCAETMTGETDLKRTPLYDAHVALGAKMVPFAGWEMPVQYTGVIPEHRAVRTQAGLFDVSHMGEIFVTGAEAERALNYLTCNDVTKLADGRAQYSAIINEQGGVVDDIIIYRYNARRYLVCVNASNADQDFAWFSKHNRFDAEFVNRSPEYGQIALQGPRAVEILRLLKGASHCDSLAYFSFQDFVIEDVPVVVARTGYTGEDGFELFIPWKNTPKLWAQLLAVGTPHGLLPIGLGARDSLRLEACYPLHGHELAPDVSALESGLGWVIKFDKGDFLGKEALMRWKTQPYRRSLAGFFLDDAGIARQGDKVFDGSGKECGVVTSGTKTPTLNIALGLALIEQSQTTMDNKLEIEVRGRRLKAHVVKKPFYKRST